MLHSRLQPIQDSKQAPDQVSLSPTQGAEHAVTVFYTVRGKDFEW